MEYQKIINLLDNAPNQLTKFRTKNWIETNDDSGGLCNSNSQIKFEALILRSSLCDYILEHRNSSKPKQWRNIIKNSAPFTYCLSEIYNTQIDNAKEIDIVIPMYNLIEYSDNYYKNIWKFMAIL